MEEVWKDIPFLNGYSASNLGRVKRNSRKSVDPRRTYYGKDVIINEIIYIPQKSIHGYHLVHIKNKGYSVHRLIAITFLENPSNKPQVNHINGVKTDNCITNLEWATASENSRHAIKIGLSNKKGVIRKSSIKNLSSYAFPKLSQIKIREIQSKYKDRKRLKCTQITLGKEYGVHKDTISKIVRMVPLYSKNSLVQSK